MHSKEARHDLHFSLHIVSNIATFPHCASDGSKLSVRHREAVNNNNVGTVSNNMKEIDAGVSIDNFSELLSYEFSKFLKRYYQGISNISTLLLNFRSLITAVCCTKFPQNF